MRRLILIICFFSPAFFAQSQTWEVGVSAGASGYMGDINPVKSYTFTDPAFGGQIKRNFNGHWSAKVGFMQGRVQGDDAKSLELHLQSLKMSEEIGDTLRILTSLTNIGAVYLITIF